MKNKIDILTIAYNLDYEAHDLTKDVAVNHYWGPFKPWKINCPFFTGKTKNND